MRLEYLMQLLSSSIDLTKLVTIYELVGVGITNRNHQILAALPAHRHFTLNMDSLLEDAGFARDRLVHLHGRWNEPATIKTTISQYLRRLDPLVEREFSDAVRGQQVLVIGYSGRDFDVLPVLLANPPAELQWIVRPGDGLWPEVRAGLEAMQRLSPDTRITITPADIGEYLDEFETSRPSRPIDHQISATASKLPLQPTWRKISNAFASVPVSDRALGMGRVLFELGLFDELNTLLATDPCDDPGSVLLRKVAARAEYHRGNYRHALSLLTRPPTTLAGTRAWGRNVNEISKLMPRMGLPWVGELLDRSLLTSTRFKSSERSTVVASHVRVRIAQHSSLRGSLSAAERTIVRVVEDANLEATLGLAGKVDALTWYLDILKGFGRYREAREIVEGLEAKIPYANLSQRAYAYWQMGAVLVLEGEPGGAKEYLKTADVLAERSGDLGAIAWVAATTSDALRLEGDPNARAVAQSALNACPSSFLVRHHLLVQLAEQARSEGDLDEACSWIAEAREVRFRRYAPQRRLTMPYLATELISVRVQAERDHEGWIERADDLRRRYLKLGAECAAAEVDLLLRNGIGKQVDRSSWLTRGWNYQEQQAAATWDWRTPWPVVT